MTVANGNGKEAAGDARRRRLAGLSVVAALAGGAVLAFRPGAPVFGPAIDGPVAAAERYELPITAPLDQGETGLCWAFAALSMLETNYMSRHPGARVEFSRAALQRDAIADRFHRLARGEPVLLTEGGLAVEALDLVRRHGLISRADFHEVVNSAPVLATLKDAVAEEAKPHEKARALDDELTEALGAKPETTHLEGRALSPHALARTALQGRTWTEFDLAHDGVAGWGPSRDPEARPETRVRYVSLNALIDLIHTSLARREAAVVGTVDHAVLVYGAEYDRAGKPLAYLVKDSLPPYLYRADAETLHEKLNDVTVTVDGPRPDFAGDRADRVPAATRRL